MPGTGTRRPLGGWERAATAAEVESRVREILNRHPAVGLAVGVVRGGRLEFFYGYGLAEISSKAPVTEDTCFRIASITKTFTAIAMMQLWEEGLVDLDAPATSYLRAYRLIPATAGARPPSARELMAHTGGMPQMPYLSRALKGLLGREGLVRLTEGGASFALDERLPTLAEYYRGALRLEAEAGTRFTYGDHGFATLGQIVEDVSGKPLDRYFREHIFEPLGMTDSDLLRSERVTSRLATGYTIGPSGPRAVKDRQWVTAAASNVYSTPRDMSRYLAALLGGGANEHGSVLRPATMATLLAAQYQTDPRVGGIGLGFYRGDLGGHLSVEHQGILPGFDSQIFLAPDDGVGVMAFSNGTRRGTSWLPRETSRLLRQLLGVPDDVVRTDVPQRPEVWNEICGWYPLHARLTETQAKSVVGLGAEVFVRRGQLMLRTLSPIPAMYRGFALHPDDESDPYVFRVDLSGYDIPTIKVVFSREPGGVSRIHSDWIPLSLERQPAARSPRPWIAGAVGALALAAAATAVRRRGARG